MPVRILKSGPAIIRQLPTSKYNNLRVWVHGYDQSRTKYHVWFDRSAHLVCPALGTYDDDCTIIYNIHRDCIAREVLVLDLD